MRVTHICTSFEGGAGICAARIIEATRALGVEARAIVANGVDCEYVRTVQPKIAWSPYWLLQKSQALRAVLGWGPKVFRISRKIAKEQRKHHGLYCFTSPVTGYTDIAEHPWVKDADVIHLHWVGNFVDYESFFSHINKPIVWTIHDENPGLGGFHYTSWKKDAPLSFQKLDDKLMELKTKAYSQINSMTLVAISQQMESYFEQSELLRRFPHVLIHNGIDGQQFSPVPQATAREELGLSQEDVVFLFSAQNIHEERKGLKELIAALESLHIPQTVLLCLGRKEFTPKASFTIQCEGFISDHRSQSLYYSAADFFMMPSFQEAFAQAPMEAMACGTPVVAFPCSGTKELISDNNGVICDDFTIDALIYGIKIAMSTTYDSTSIRTSVLSHFSYEYIAQQYIQLYQEQMKLEY